MNKLILLLIFISVFSSCSKTKELTSIMHRSTINETSKDIVQIIHTDVGTDTIILKGFDSATVYFSKLTTVESSSLSIGEAIAPPIVVTKELTYCLTDTLKFEYLIEYSYRDSNDFFGETDSDRLYESLLLFELDSSSTDSNPFVKVKFTFKDSLVSYMQKDYSMLGKFPEYYSKQ